MAFFRIIMISVIAMFGLFFMGSQSAALQDVPVVNVRLGQHPDYSRVVFDFPVEIPYRAIKDGNRITVTFDANFDPDLSAFNSTNLTFISAPVVTKDAGLTIVSFTVPESGGLKHFRSNTFIVIDALETAEQAIVASVPQTVDDQNTSDQSSSGQTSDTAADVDDNLSNQDTNAEDVTAPLNPVVENGAPLTLSASATFEELKVNFDIPSNAGLAVFERAQTLWVIFDRPFTVPANQIGTVLQTAGARINSFVQDENIDATVIRMDVLDNQSTVVTKDGARWTIAFKDNIAKPRFPLSPIRRVESSGQQVFIPVANIGRKIEIEDPVVGDVFAILPLLDQGRGVPEHYDYAMASVLETSQGIAVIPQTDTVRVERFREGVSISEGDISFARNNEDAGNTQFKRLIDFKAWREGEDWEYQKQKSRLFYEISISEGEEKNALRWRLARFYLAHGRAAEALGALALMEDFDPTLRENAEFVAVRGVANFKQGRLEAADRDLSIQALSSEQDIELWKTLIAEARGQFDEALEHYRLGKDVIGTYDDGDKADIQLAVIRAALENGDLDLAREELQLFNGLNLSERQLSESIYLSAQLQEKMGNTDVSLLQYEDLSGALEHDIATGATFQKVLGQLEKEEISDSVAIEELERLRYRWRGDRLEVEIMSKLADLYFKTKNYAAGLSLLRLTLTYYPDLSREFSVASRMGTVFSDLFLGGKADDLPPVSAIALFFEFEELAPFGTRGDLMIRRLSDRLVSLDLLGRAAELLEYQVAERLEGAARAQIAGNLAKIYLLDKNPQKALEMLRATREPRLPQDIEIERMRIESRALIESARFEEAEILIESDRSAAADRLRADIYWASKDWQRFIAVSRRLLGDGWRNDAQLEAVEKLNLIRMAIAMTFTEDRAGLIEARRRYGNQMRDGDFSRAFTLLTSDQQLSGRELGSIASQIASVEKLQTFMRDYRNDFSGR
ncbi:hypothetical protein [Kordiimonas sp. SCSIO 12610]|uniref:hypothetical protein n=1 Tax=Kordiimonas sp. SCSIO 12610 TaxID=2829597 RepID=UPI00210D3322|nr:hypothetical protein [Kordiimonas sp. SCSIO 12610]UTW54172.1 hypothetical protein KFF44_10055 [Kordiimonas sp. SCSIO 12610]